MTAGNLLSVLAPATLEPDSVAELAANKTKGKIILSLTWKSCFWILSSVLTGDLHFPNKTGLVPVPTWQPFQIKSYLTLRVITFALWQAWNTSMVLFLHLQGKRTENYSSIFWQNHLSAMLWFFIVKLTYYSNTNLVVFISAWPLSPAASRTQEWCEKFHYQHPPAGEEIISCFSSGLDSLIDQVKAWHHHPCLTSSPYQGGVILVPLLSAKVTLT